MIRFLVIAALLFVAFVLGIIVARDDLREDAIDHARTAMTQASRDAARKDRETARKDKDRKSGSPSWGPWGSSGPGDQDREDQKVATRRDPPPTLRQSPDAPVDYTVPEERLPVSPAEEATVRRSQEKGKTTGDPERLRRAEERRAERERLLAMTPEQRKAYREERKAEREARRAQRGSRNNTKTENPQSVEDILEDNP